MDIEGRTEPGYEGVRAAFATHFSSHGDIGAAFCLYVKGRKVVDIWGGLADVRTGRQWEEETLR
jgi:hypothetical protein